MTIDAFKRIRTARVDTSPFRSFVVFLQVAGKWWFSAWVVVVMAGLVALGLSIAQVSQLPSATWVLLLALGVVLAPTVAFHTLRIQRDEFKAMWDDKALVIDVLARLEQLRTEAAPLQIKGMTVRSSRSVSAWIKMVDDWTSRAIDTAGLLHPAEAGNIKTLGVFKVSLAAGSKPFNARHLTAIRNFVRRMQILADIRDRWTARS